MKNNFLINLINPTYLELWFLLIFNVKAEIAGYDLFNIEWINALHKLVCKKMGNKSVNVCHSNCIFQMHYCIEGPNFFKHLQ